MIDPRDAPCDAMMWQVILSVACVSGSIKLERNRGEIDTKYSQKFLRIETDEEYCVRDYKREDT